MSVNRLLMFFITVLTLTGMGVSVFQPGSALTAISADLTYEAKPGVDVEPELVEQFEEKSSTGYLIYFRTDPDLSLAQQLDWNERGLYVMKTLQEAARNSQKEVRDYLDMNGISYQSFWIDNLIVVESSTEQTFKGLVGFPGISSLKARRSMRLAEPLQPASEVPLNLFAVEPNLTHIHADDAWALGYTGSGMVVANIDSGVRFTHNALRNQYRGSLGGGVYDHNYNWFDPNTPSYSSPFDGDGHGTHTMGIMVGSDGSTNQTGVAPGAEWIACRGCTTKTCSDTALLACAQFIAAPTNLAGNNPDPTKRPHAVNNSWGNCDRAYDNWYQGVVNSWHMFGIYPVFSNGNAANCGYSSPPGLNTVGNPARYGNVTGVGSSTLSSGEYASHSTWGPTDNLDTTNPRGYPALKPQVLAPGVTIRSSYYISDNSYSLMTGTSMSAPHVSALVALVWQAGPCLVGDYAATETLIEQTAVPIPYASGGVPLPGPGDIPNYATGWGEIDVLAAVLRANTECREKGALAGTVTMEGTTTPVAGADIIAALSPTTTYTTQTGEDGAYAFPRLNEGTYTVTANKFGFLPHTATDVVIISGNLTTKNFSLSAAPVTTLKGVVSDALAGWPLYAQISIAGGPLSPIWTDPVTGRFELDLPQGIPYTLTATAWVQGYDPQVLQVSPAGAIQFLDFQLLANLESCSAPGYTASLVWLDAEESHARAKPPLPARCSVTGTSGPDGNCWVDFLELSAGRNTLHLDTFHTDNAACVPGSGGLVVGVVYDDRQGISLTGAEVLGDAGQAALGLTTSDPVVDNAFYTLYSPSGAHILTATFPAYGASSETVEVVGGGTVWQGFYLPSGYIVAPASAAASVELGKVEVITITLLNQGSWAASFELTETDLGFITTAKDDNSESDFQVQNDILWLAPAPATGIIPPYSSQNIRLTFDASGVIQAGVYQGELVVLNNTPYGDPVIPVTMTTTRPPYGFIISSDTSSTGTAGETVAFSLSITNTGYNQDSYTVEIIGSSWQAVSSHDIVGPLQPGETTTITITVTIPLISVAGEQADTQVIIHSVSDSSISDSTTLTTKVIVYKIYLPLVQKEILQR